MAKSTVIAFLMLTSVVIPRVVAADPIEVLDEDEYNEARDIGEADYDEEVALQGIDLLDPPAPKPPNPTCTMICEVVETAASAACNFLSTPAQRLGCAAGVAAGASVCRWVCTQ